MEAIGVGGSSSAALCKELAACGLPKAMAVAELQGVAQTGVPPGWRRHYATLLHGLKATASPVKRAIRVSGPSFDNGAVLLQVTMDDPVLTGLVRKARARMSCTCMTCGKVGKPRQVGFNGGVLCASCYTERRLRLQLRMMSNAIVAAREFGCGIVSEGHVPPLIRRLVADEAWKSAFGPARSGEAAVRVRYLTVVQCEQLMPLIRALQATVDTVLEAPGDETPS